LEALPPTSKRKELAAERSNFHNAKNADITLFARGHG
jgi:hypothetical protein